ncbi:MAG TPA: RNA polymerase sigma factor [Ktedonobacteraceae bacterium]|jgi:RNA polymerase sigma-70 factor, ECF subfamily|nr:RNA polymerase sigma factor [Ktedonobacteraceae bacterium]
MPVLLAYEPTIRNSAVMEHEYTEAVAEQQEEMETDVIAEHLESYALAARALGGETDAFEKLVASYRGMMLRVAYRIVRDQASAEDAVQDALILAWQHLPGLREAGALRSWLMRIVVNQCLSLKRRHARATQFALQSLAEQETDLAAGIAEQQEGYLERNWDIARAIEKLPAKQQPAIILHYYHGMTLSEMSQTLQISENTLKKRIQAALINLRRMLHVADRDKAVSRQ